MKTLIPGVTVYERGEKDTVMGGLPNATKERNNNAGIFIAWRHIETYPEPLQQLGECVGEESPKGRACC